MPVEDLDPIVHASTGHEAWVVGVPLDSPHSTPYYHLMQGMDHGTSVPKENSLIIAGGGGGGGEVGEEEGEEKGGKEGGRWGREGR